MKLIRLSKNTFTRNYGVLGYITNQITKFDQCYNETGADFLSKITRSPRDITNILNELKMEYADVSFDDLKTDFLNFIEDLEQNGFILVGDTESEIQSKEVSFSYKRANPKTEIYDFTNPDNNKIAETTQLFYKEFYKSPRVFGLQIEVSSRCNERCIHCYIPNKKKDAGKDIEFPLIQRVMDEASEMGTLQLTLSGGEPFMHNEFDKILEYAREKDFIINILSNLTLLNDNHIELLKVVNPSLVQVSLYSMKPEEHDAITLQKGSYNKTKNAIERLVEADIPVQISCPVMKLNYKSYKDVLIYANKLRTKAYSDFIMMAQADCNTNNLASRINLSETEELIKDMLQFDKDYLNSTLQKEPKSFDIEKYKKMPVCGVGIDSICLTANGDYYPCAGWQGLIVGNAYKNSLKEVWDNSKELQSLREITFESFPECIKCEAKDYCAMCLVRNFNENKGDMFKVSKHFCEVAFLNKKLVEDYYAQKNNK